MSAMGIDVNKNNSTMKNVYKFSISLVINWNNDWLLSTSLFK